MHGLTQLPSVAGMRFCQMNSLAVMLAPWHHAITNRNMLAMQCSKPIMAKAEMGSQMPTALPVRSCGGARGQAGDVETMA